MDMIQPVYVFPPHTPTPSDPVAVPKRVGPRTKMAGRRNPPRHIGVARVVDYWASGEAGDFADALQRMGFQVTRTITKKQKKSGPCGYIAAWAAAKMAMAGPNWRTVDLSGAVKSSVVVSGNKVLEEMSDSDLLLELSRRQKSHPKAKPRPATYAYDLFEEQIDKLAREWSGNSNAIRYPLAYQSALKFFRDRSAGLQGVQVMPIGLNVDGTGNQAPGTTNHWMVVAWERS